MSEPTLQPTPLTSRHRDAGARMAPFAGWEMPVEFGGTLAEHAAVREDVGVFDVSHLGNVYVQGDAAAEVIGRSFSCDTTRVEVGASTYTLCCDEQGGVIDDLIVYHLAEDRWMAVPNAANTAAVVERLESVAAAVGGVEVDDRSTQEAIIAVQGPRALDVASDVLGIDVRAVPHLRLAVSDVDASRGAMVVRTGYTGEPGCEVVAPADLAPRLWDALLAAAATPCGLGARDTLRLEMGYPLHGHELSREINPYEARMGWAVKLDHEFVGRDALAAIREAGPSRRLWGLRVDGRRPLREGLTVRRDGHDVGVVTSGSFSPTLQVGIGLALLDDPIGPDDEVAVDVRGRDVAATVVRPPFVPSDPRD
jgi:aminomethyltransferase